MSRTGQVQQIVEQAVATGEVPGAVAALAGPDVTDVGAAGRLSLDGPPMPPDAVFRIASVTKIIVSTATLVLVERGVLDLDAPAARWLPELDEPRVLRHPGAELDDTVPADGPVLVGHLPALRGGLGFTADFSTPITAVLMDRLHQGPPNPARTPDPDSWLAEVGRTPLVHQPGQGWTYNTGFDLLGVLLARAAGTTLGEVLEDTVLGPLGMRDTGFRLRPDQLPRTTAAYRPDGDGLTEVDPADGAWAGPVPFESAGGGLVSTVDDLLVFGRMLLDGGRGPGCPVLSAASVARLMTPGTPSEPDDVFLAGQSWALGGAVDVRETHPFEVRGRYGWTGGTGTALYVYPRSRLVAVWLTQREMAGPADGDRLVPLLTLAADRERAA